MAEMMVLIAKTSAGSVAFKVHVPLTDEDMRRLKAIQDQPCMGDAEWTGRAGKDVR